MITKKIISVLVYVFIFSRITAQVDKYRPYYLNDFPNTPSTATFLRYGNLQNSEYTGTNTPKIPLFTITEGDIQFALNLSYISGNGIKVRDEASSLGLGWGLPLATITQTVWGGFDDLSNYTKLKFEYLYDSTPPFIRNPFKVCENSQIPSQYLGQLNYDKFTYYKSYKAMIPIENSFKNFNYGVAEYDTSPDIFVCNLFGEKLEFITSNFSTNIPTNYNTQFFIPTFECINKKGYKIQYNTNDLFIITSPVGIKYYFSKSEEYGQGAITSSGLVSIPTIQGRNFVVTKIMDKNNKIINIEYDENLNIKLIPNYTQNLNLTMSYSFNDHSDGYFPPNSYNNGSCNPVAGYSQEYMGEYNSNINVQPYASSQTIGSYFIPTPINGGLSHKNMLLVKMITGDFGNINFQYSDRLDHSSRKLDNITINDNYNHTVKKIDFDYSYFQSQNSSTARSEADNLHIVSGGLSFSQDFYSKRLKLNSISINSVENYFFEYNPVIFPDKDSFAVDYWGYFNGSITNKTLFPNPNDFIFNISGVDITSVPNSNYNNNDKHSNNYFAKAGILEKIIYPTKGYSIFDYEMNVADNLFKSNNPSILNQGNGLRIKKQTNYDENSNIVEQTEFEYEGGKALNPLSLFKQYSYKLLMSPPAGSGFNTFRTHNFKVLSMLASSDRSVSPLSSGDGIGYSNVVKKNIHNNISKGKTTTYYNNEPDYEYQFKDDNVPVYFPIIKSITSSDNGLINKIRIFDNSNILIKEINNQYINKYSNLFYGTSFINYFSYAKTNACVNPSFCNINGVYMPQVIDNPVSAFSFYPLFSKEILLSSSTIIDYINGQELQTVITNYYNDNNLLSQKSTLTPASTQISESFSYSSLIPRLSQANILSENTEKRVYKNGRQILYQTTNYNDTSHYNPTSILTYDLLNNNNSYTEVTYDKYDSKGNLQQYTTKDGISTVIIWGYDHTQPISKIEGAQLSGISQSLIDTIVNASNTDAQNGTETSEQNLISALDTFRSDASLSGYQISTYTYDPLIGVRSITPPSGIREYYRYDAANRLEKVIDSDKKVLKEFKYNYKN